MAWIKRNLYFLIGSVIALVLMGLAGWYLYSMWQKNNTILEDLDKEYGELANLNNLNPSPGSAKVDNVKAAKEQRQQLRDYIHQTRPYFQRILPIPDLPRLTDREFSTGLSRAIDQMQRDAANASVSLQPRYSFSFEAQKQAVSFAVGSLPPLAVQLGEVKAISDILFQAKINWLDNIRRVRVSPDDFVAVQTDYLAEPSVTNDLAVLSPYEMTFRCFSSELASVLAGFASSPYGLIVKTINVELAPAANAEPSPAGVAGAANAYAPSPQPVSAADGPGAEPANGRFAFPGRVRASPGAASGAHPYPYSTRATQVRPGGLPTVLDEKLLKITLTLDVVKLLPFQ